MPTRWDTIQGKKGRGIGQVTNEQKNAVISKAESRWKEMGLTDKEIAFGIATMGVESGFDPKAKSTDPKSTAEGLGQFNDKTWSDAVNLYNKKFNAHLKPDSSRQDPDAQIAVMGAWIPYVMDRTKKFEGSSEFKDYNQTEIAYGLWHTGAYASTGQLQDFLIDKDHKSGFKNNRAYLNSTHKEAYEIQTDPWKELRGVPLTPSHNLDPATLKALKGLPQGLTIRPGLGDTLRREGNKVWRIDFGTGKTHGYFISE
ncbi:MAG: transglycosylase SLT domain-containing protein [Deltaproteobacteria bacterium]|nr:transglycosylase SLT domain-containing protein [Deltaproteobacteria bacterium]